LIRLLVPRLDFHPDQQQLGHPMGHIPPSPSMGHPALPDLATVDGTPMKYTHNSQIIPIIYATKYIYIIYLLNVIIVGFFNKFDQTLHCLTSEKMPCSEKLGGSGVMFLSCFYVIMGGPELCNLYDLPYSLLLLLKWTNYCFFTL
jgi:hypothetical protein